MKYRFIFLVLLFCFLGTTVPKANAQIPFGGRTVLTHECACSGGWMMYIFDQKTKLVLPFVFQFGASRLNSNFNIFTPGTSVVGSATPAGICIPATKTGCAVPIPAFGTITPRPLPGIGTSSI